MKEILKTELGVSQKVELGKMNLLYKEVDNNLESQKKAWPEFESHFPSLTGRKMFGFDYDNEKKYRVCSQVLDEDNGNKFGLDEFEFEGGNYLRLRLKCDPPELYEKIGPAYDFLFDNYEDNINWSLPVIEYYKAKNILDIMIPINE